MSSLLLAVVLLQPKPLKVLFIGNSHTASRDVPNQVRMLLRSAGTEIETGSQIGAQLSTLAELLDVRTEIRTGKWNFVVLQGAGLSSSHKYVYSQDGAISLAKQAISAGAKPILYAEWPRRGWDETDYILGIYGKIAKPTGAKIAPVCVAFDLARKQIPDGDWWAGDGNHSGVLGAYVAALTLASSIQPEKTGKLTWHPSGVSDRQAEIIRKAVERTQSAK